MMVQEFLTTTKVKELRFYLRISKKEKPADTISNNSTLVDCVDLKTTESISSYYGNFQIDELSHNWREEEVYLLSQT